MELQKVQSDPLEAYKRGFEDFQFFAALAMPTVMKHPLPLFYIAIWRMLVQAWGDPARMAKILRFALGLPRGFAKTTFIKILICWFFVYDYSKFVLIVCADEPLAYNLLGDIDHILASPNMEAIYGKWAVNKAIDNKEQKTAIYRKIPRVLVAVGANSSVRGLNIHNERPDFILFDDMQTSDNAKSDTESATLLERFTGTFLKLVSPDFALVCYIGNMYPANCILAKLRDNKAWTSLITGCILADGKSLWPELHPIAALYEGFKHDEAMGLAHIWFAEMMNDPILSRVSLLPDGVIPECPFTEEDYERATTGFIVIDPAGLRKMSDENVILANLVIDDKPVIVDGHGGIQNPEEVIKKALEFCITYNISVIGIESVAYQQTLCFWMMKFIKETPGLDHIQVVELSPAGRQKEMRIISWTQSVLAQTYYVSGEARLKILWQALAYKLGKKDNKDDWLDAGAYGEDMRSNYWEVLLSAVRTINQAPRPAVIGNNVGF